MPWDTQVKLLYGLAAAKAAPDKPDLVALSVSPKEHSIWCCTGSTIFIHRRVAPGMINCCENSASQARFKRCYRAIFIHGWVATSDDKLL